MLSHARPCAALAASLLLVACGGGAAREEAQTGPVTLTLGAYTTPREAYGREILPAFVKKWKDSTGQTITFQESYLGSGAQARAIAGGFEADVAALSLEPDIETVAKAGLITHDWKQQALGGMVSRSVVVIAVRPGNPKNIQNWDDLTRPGLKVLTPNPKTSGGAMWNIAALYGAALRGATKAPAGDSAAAGKLLQGILANVAIMDKGARESMLTFETGTGDAAITYENEVLVARQAGKPMDYVIPKGTILIENPAAVVDGYADRHKTRAVADAFVNFLGTAEAQRMFAKYGLRPADDKLTSEFAESFQAVPGLFTIRDIGGWPAVTATLFANGGVFERASAAAAKSAK
jgi:sulfate transport system substrate-binding protein